MSERVGTSSGISSDGRSSAEKIDSVGLLHLVTLPPTRLGRRGEFECGGEGGTERHAGIGRECCRGGRNEVVATKVGAWNRRRADGGESRGRFVGSGAAAGGGRGRRIGGDGGEVVIPVGEIESLLCPSRDTRRFPPAARERARQRRSEFLETGCLSNRRHSPSGRLLRLLYLDRTRGEEHGASSPLSSLGRRVLGRNNNIPVGELEGAA